MARARTRTGTAERIGHLTRSRSWSGLRNGDRVDVQDPRERRAAWRFVAHVTNDETGERWVEVVGGRAGEQRNRSFREDQIFPYRSLRAGGAARPSVVDAPGLPF